MMERKHFRAAVDAFRQGDRENAYRLLQQVVHDDPQCVPAWLWMSGLVEDRQEQRQYMEQALTIDPNCVPAREGLALLRLRELLSSVPETIPLLQEIEARKLGDYLIARGIISPEQLEAALAEQQATQTEYAVHRPLGDILMERGWLTPYALATTLLLQYQTRHRVSDVPLPQRLGEYLVVEGLLTPEQIAAVLSQQAQAYESGTYMMLGELLIRGGYLSTAVLADVLEQQRADFFSSLSTQVVQ